MAPYELRPAAETDSEALFRIHRAAMGEHLARAIGPLTDEHEREQHAKWLLTGRAQVIVVGDQVAGLLDVEWQPEVVRVNRIAIDPAFQGRGIGAAILGELLRECGERHMPVRLEVFPQNPARRLYQRLGFHDVGIDGPSIMMRWDPPD